MRFENRNTNDLKTQDAERSFYINGLRDSICPICLPLRRLLEITVAHIVLRKNMINENMNQ